MRTIPHLLWTTLGVATAAVVVLFRTRQLGIQWEGVGTTTSTAPRSSTGTCAVEKGALSAPCYDEEPTSLLPSSSSNNGSSIPANQLEPPRDKQSSRATKPPKLPLPVRVLEQYREWHSVESLRRDPHRRKFSVVFYSCPLQAGNRIHHFLNGMLWSILTNRTMLWRYWDTPTCRKYGLGNSEKVCRNANTADDCASVLTRAPWIPSHDEWQQRLNLSDPYRVPMRFINRNFDEPQPGNASSRNRFEDRSVVYFPEVVVKNSYKGILERPGNVAHSAWSRATNDKLHSLGIHFLYGMLHHATFSLTEAVKASIPPQVPEWRDPDQSYTVALHSRHVQGTDDGCDIRKEQRCVLHLEAKRRRSKKGESRRNRVVFLMSDRACALSNLTTWLSNRGYQVLVASHDSRTDYLSEHGPFAGAGFFQDVALAMHARSAFVGGIRSSSDLLRELLTYHRKMEAWERAVAAGEPNPRAAMKGDLEFCSLGTGNPLPPETNTTSLERRV